MMPLVDATERERERQKETERESTYLGYTKKCSIFHASILFYTLQHAKDIYRGEMEGRGVFGVFRSSWFAYLHEVERWSNRGVCVDVVDGQQGQGYQHN